MAFLGIDTAVLQEWHRKACEAYNQVLTGDKVVEIMVDGYTTKFNRVNADQLYSYILRLQAEIGGRASTSAISITF